MKPVASLILVLAVAAASARSTPVSADSAIDVAHHVRTTDRRLARLIDEGRRASPRFRTLLARLVRSDVIVYFQCLGYVNVGGRLTFIGQGGGYRYLLVRLGRVTSPTRQIALIGHELQHAVEIADSPEIVDAESLAAQYRRFGHVKRATLTSTDYDTDAAVEVGYQVLRELAQ